MYFRLLDNKLKISEGKEFKIVQQTLKILVSGLSQAYSNPNIWDTIKINTRQIFKDKHNRTGRKNTERTWWMMNSTSWTWTSWVYIIFNVESSYGWLCPTELFGPFFGCNRWEVPNRQGGQVVEGRWCVGDKEQDKEHTAQG